MVFCCVCFVFSLVLFVCCLFALFGGLVCGGFVCVFVVVVLTIFFFLNKERASVSNNTCTNSGMKNKDRYCKIHFQVLNSDIEKNIMFY